MRWRAKSRPASSPELGDGVHYIVYPTSLEDARGLILMSLEDWWESEPDVGDKVSIEVAEYSATELEGMLEV